MPNVTADDWDETSPALNQARRAGATEITALRKAVAARFAKEHVEPDAAGVGGEHKAGSAKIYYRASAPTLRPDGVTSLTADDNGRIWIDSNTMEAKCYVHPDWVSPVLDLKAFHKVTADAETSGVGATSVPFTQSSLAPGTWMVMIYGFQKSTVSPSSAYLISAVVNSITAKIFMQTDPGGTPYFMIPALVTVTGAGTISITAVNNIHRIQGMYGFRVGS